MTRLQAALFLAGVGVALLLLSMPLDALPLLGAALVFLFRKQEGG